MAANGKANGSSASLLIPMLPDLRKGNETFRGLTSSDWVFRSFDDLASLADALDLPATNAALESVDAVPDVWARVLLFSRALTDDKHVLHDSASAAYKGFLAVLALYRQKKWSLTTVPVDLEGAKERFLTVARNLAPTLSLRSDTKWDRLSIFVLDSQPIGITSPLTIVYPADGTHLTAPSIIPWWKKGQFVNPVPFLVPEQRSWLSGWIKTLARELSESSESSESSSNVKSKQLIEILVGLLGTFSDELGPEREYSIAPESLGINYGIYTHIDRSLAPVASEIKSSMVRLREMRGLAQKELLVLDFAIADKWSIPEPEILYLSNLSFADIKSRVATIGGRIELEKRDRIADFSFPAGVEWRIPGDFFTDSLAIVDNEPNAFPGAFRVRAQDEVASRFDGSPILPLRSELLGYLTPEYVKNNTSFEIASDAIRVLLKLPVGNDRSLNISRIYSKSDVVRVKPPVLDVWPNFRTEGDDTPKWQIYFSFWDNGADRNAFYAEPRSLGIANVRTQEIGGQTNELQREVVQLNAPPEYYVCYPPRQTGSSTELGILLVDLAVHQFGNQPTSFHVGVDFGTTNTHVFLRDTNNEVPTKLHLSTWTHSVTTVPIATRQGRLYRFFIPTGVKTPKGEKVELREEQAPFLSLFRLRPIPLGDRLDPVLSGHILYYQEDYNLGELKQGSVTSYLKWEHSGGDKLGAYLQQIAVQSAAEAFKAGARRIEFYYSVPTAFSPKTQARVEGVWQETIRWVEKVTGIKCGGAERGETESIAAARYFSNSEYPGRALPSEGAVFVDIGGATSDISVWRENDLRCQASIKIAGRDLLLRPFFQLRATLLPLLIDHDRDYFGQEQEESRFASELDALLRARGDVIQRKFAKSDDKHSVALRQVIGLGLAGIFYYLGLLVRRLRNGDPSLNKFPDVYVGGNGCRLFQWLSEGAEFRDSAPIGTLFKAMAVEAASLNRDFHPITTVLGRSRRDKFGFQIRLSKEPKAEAAYGLVVRSQLRYNSMDTRAFQEIVSGESFGSSRGSEQPTGLLKQSQLDSGISVQGLDQLRNFITFYNQFAKDKAWGLLPPIKNPEGILDRVLKEVRQWTEDLKGQGDNIEVEPIFVIALRSLLRSLPVND